MDDVFLELNRIIDELILILGSNHPIEEDPFFILVGKYSKSLKTILRKYFEISEQGKIKLSPYLNFYRQIQHYLVFILRYPSILQIPHHSEIMQTLNFIKRKEELINDVYMEYSKKNRCLFSGSFKNRLNSLYNKKKQ